MPKDPSATLKVAEHKNEKFSSNTELEDNFGNKITVPSGFKITSDSPNNVTSGIVIEDVDAGTAETVGSQFVWIPVGSIYTNQNKTESKTITLGRYEFDSNGIPNKLLTVETVKGYSTAPLEAKDYFDNMFGEGAYDEITSLSDKDDATIQAWINAGGDVEKKLESMTSPYIEEETSREGSSTQNATAKNLNDFLSKASKGYYIGRYEARTTETRTTSGDAITQVTEKSGNSVYNYVTQLQASERSRNMYTSEDFDSDLINSYAYDTAILFLQEFDDRVDKSVPYSRISDVSPDIICNIYDLGCGSSEWTTEIPSDHSRPCIGRGGFHFEMGSYSSKRDGYYVTDSYSDVTFRPILYL